MITTKKFDKIILRKILSAVFFGLTGFLVNFYSVSFIQFQDFQVNILFGLLFPLTITIHWGWKYGLISALAGGCQTMWWLWETDGYGIIFSVPVYTLWIVWHGFWSDYRRSHKIKNIYNMYIVEIPFRIFSASGFYLVFRWLVSLNPPPWFPDLINNYVAISWVNFVVIKHIITAYILLLICDLLTYVKPARIFFMMDKTEDYRNTTYFINISILTACFLWIIHSIMDYLVFYNNESTLLDLMFSNIPPASLFSRNLFLLIFIIFGVVMSRIQIKLKQQEMVIRKNEERLNRSQSIAHLGYWELDHRTNLLIWSDETYRIFGFEPGQFIPSYDKFLTLVHPEDVDDVNRAFSESIEKKMPTYEIEHRIISKNSESTRYVFETCQNKINNSGEILISDGTIHDITDRIHTEKKLQQSINEKNTLIKELYHRTKNNMQVISSMLLMQARRSDSEFIKNAFRDIVSRIKAMALVHVKLYESQNLSEIFLDEYISDFSNLLIKSYNTGFPISLNLSLEKIPVTIDTAIPLGLVLNELFTNSIKYAFPEKKEAKVSISMYKENELIIIDFSDTGVGIPVGFNLRNCKTVGLQNVFSIIEYQLKGKIDYSTNRGLKWHIEIDDYNHITRI